MTSSSNFFQGMFALVNQSWRFFTSIKFPGTNFTFAHLFMFLIFVPLAIGFFKSLLGFGGLGSANEVIKGTSSTARVDRLNTKQTEREARRFVGRGF